ncbi:MAG: MarR family transcriptional regulator [Candidatus Diapherotrites archaeon]|nr:MarR family transcriptional regulator [Candidatus Diapherotrites archaeon]
MVKGESEKDALRIKMLSAVIGRAARHDLEKRLEAEKAAINPLGLGVLRALCRNNCTISELSQKLFLASATLVPVIDSLEKDGFITRKSDPKDRRRNPLLLTAKGKEIISKIPFVHKNDSIVTGLSKIGKKKTGKLIQLLGELADNMSEDPKLSEKILYAINNGKKSEFCFEAKSTKK